MPNPYFRFKQFTIYHDRCAMKVSTDSCIFGAWFAAKALPSTNILDIGAGSGLLTLMLAQKMPATFHAIEKDAGSFEQLEQNIHNSPWNNRITTFHSDAVRFEFPGKYDFIISNPPFYENELRSPDNRKNMAMHDSSLTLDMLIQIIDRNLTQDGSFGILLPYYRKDHFMQLAGEKKFYTLEECHVRQTPQHPYFRSILHFSKSRQPVNPVRTLTIRNSSNTYTPEFISLLKDYYLAL
ncbi:MAG: methyltransferase [Chitinophagaceae bacterium]|nr:methyltransferase [Chitinophagaceae bacterium]